MTTSPTPVTLDVVHETRYAYAAPVSLAHHLAHLQPLHDAAQQRLAHTLAIEPAPDGRREGHDAWGHATTWFHLARPHTSLVVRATSRVRLLARFRGLEPARSPAWDAIATGLAYVAGRPFEPALEFTLPSPYVPRLDALRDWAAPELPPGRPLAEAALALMQRLHVEFAYQSASTAVDTPLAQAFAQRRGVCQDFAHLLVGALRMHGVPARYVSGYLRTAPPAGQAPLVGADASHAWVQVWCPGTPGVPEDGWLDLDPTNACVPSQAHVRVATGRDYGDVAPLRGVIRGGGRHDLAVAVSTTEAPAGAPG